MHGQTPPPEKPEATRHRFTGDRAYYVSQLSGWTLYAVLQILLSPEPRVTRAVMFAAAWCGTGALGTHVLRWYAHRHRWQTVRQLVAPFAVAALVIPTMMNAARFAVHALIYHENIRTEPAGVVVAHSIQAVLVVSVWCAVFLSANEATRRRLAEMESLRLALIAQVSQFRALRSQLNPLFLFNCLNSVRELIDEDRHRAKEVINLLSTLLRYTLRADGVETVSLREELRAVKDYLLLEKVRFEERLRIQFNIDPQSLDATLPAMLLQTLAENGVKHGIARLPAGGELAVMTQVLQGTLHVEVTNTGVLSAATDNSSAVGLDNARERLRLMYGASASLTLTAMDEHRVRAAVTIPMRVGGLGS